MIGKPRGKNFNFTLRLFLSFRSLTVLTANRRSKGRTMKKPSQAGTQEFKAFKCSQIKLQVSVKRSGAGVYHPT